MTIDPNSAAAIPIQLFRDDQFITYASGCVYRHNRRTFVLTNWHVLSGRHAHSGLPLDERTLAIPNRIEIPYLQSMDTTKPISTLSQEWFRWVPKWTWMRHSILEVDGRARWYQHPLGRRVDIAALPIDILTGTAKASLLPIDSHSHPISLENGSDCFVIGFPLAPDPEEPLPIWKRATIASEFQLDYKGLPCFLIDTATRSGMSGSPVIIRPPDGAIGGSTAFMGIYSGRLGANDIGQVQLGVVWRKAAVEEMLNNLVMGTPETGIDVDPRLRI